MILLKDFTALKFIHPWMHKPENYWLHSQHHKIHQELNAIHSFRIDKLDVFFEQAFGLVLLMLFQLLIYRSISIHLCAVFFTGYHDLVLHSVNPYSVVHFNVILDYFCKPNLEHNLHHIIQEEYYMFNSFRHFNRKVRDEDVVKYNELLGTNISFDILI